MKKQLTGYDIIEMCEKLDIFEIRKINKYIQSKIEKEDEIEKKLEYHDIFKIIIKKSSLSDYYKKFALTYLKDSIMNIMDVDEDTDTDSMGTCITIYSTNYGTCVVNHYDGPAVIDDE